MTALKNDLIMNCRISSVLDSLAHHKKYSDEANVKQFLGFACRGDSDACKYHRGEKQMLRRASSEPLLFTTTKKGPS